MTRRIKREPDTVLLHQTDAAYQFARWAIGQPNAAAAVVQEVLADFPPAAGRLHAANARVQMLRKVRAAVLDQLQSGAPSDPAAGDPGRFCDLGSASPGVSNIGAIAAGMQLDETETERLRCAIADLAFEQREVLLLRDAQGLSYREVAAVVAVSLQTMTSRLWHARERLEIRFRGSPARRPQHNEILALVDAYIDAEVDIDTAAALVQHIAGCSVCADCLLNRSRLAQHVRAVTACRAPADLHLRMQQRRIDLG
jgi:DNA-directed RNA polymerase specialized sigma24 family protein